MGRRPRRGRRKFRGRRRGPEHRINQHIKAPTVRVVQSDNKSYDGVMSREEALKNAEEAGLDLVEIAPKADPPVVRIIEYSKFMYEKKKKDKEAKAKQHKVVLKEVRFGPNTDDHDFQFKTNHARKFLEEGNKVKAYIHFRGRSIVHKDIGRDLLDRFIEELSDVSEVESKPHMEGKRMYLIMAPTKGPNK